MAAAPITGRDVIARLREIYPGRSMFDIAHEVGASDSKWLQRIGEGFGPNQQALVDLLYIAGFLNPESEIAPEEAQERAALRAALRQAAKGPEVP